MYFLDNLHFTLDSLSRSGSRRLQDQDHIVIEIVSHSLGTRPSVSHADSLQQVVAFPNNEDQGLLIKDCIVTEIVSHTQGTRPSISHMDSSQEVDVLPENEDLLLLVKDCVVT